VIGLNPTKPDKTGIKLPFSDGGQMTDSYWSVEQIANYLGVSKDTVYSWISAKGMPAHRLGRLWKFKQEEVDVWVKSGGAAARRDAEPNDEDER
jgi:excisionase family DNA binding protein